ncbi:MAG: putative ABC transporter, ATP-binding protein [Bellilinea sp.]|nr:MAG: putative ABC transporter, ATP-binding protein [Bellilinea sp.]
MAGIQFVNVSKQYPGATAPAVDNITLEIPEGAMVVLLGPSGCGKTTLLKMVNRLHEPTSGIIFLNGVDIQSMPVNQLRRNIGYVIQQVGLFPHLTIAKNIAVVPELLRWERQRIERRIDELLDLVHLPLDFRNRYPAQLSGGQQQRVGLARALAADPQVMLMDEPFGAIDAITRESLQDQLLELQRRLKKTILFVTHDVEEALKLADEIIVLDKGRLIQKDTPCNLLANPASDFVRQLLNTDDRIRQLSLVRVETVMKSLDSAIQPDQLPQVPLGTDLKRVLSVMLSPGVDTAVVITDEGDPIGFITFEEIRKVGCLST